MQKGIVKCCFPTYKRPASNTTPEVWLALISPEVRRERLRLIDQTEQKCCTARAKTQETFKENDVINTSGCQRHARNTSSEEVW